MKYHKKNVLDYSLVNKYCKKANSLTTTSSKNCTSIVLHYCGYGTRMHTAGMRSHREQNIIKHTMYLLKIGSKHHLR